MKTKIVSVVGPTASGKTALAIALAKELNGEIISCDSMQIYRMMDIGTAKPTKEEQAAATHHLIDIVDPDVSFSCADYAVLAKEKIDEISKKGKLPIFCGGTGLYVDHVLNNTSFSDAGRDDDYREYINKQIDEFGVEGVFEELQKVDPESAESIHPNNTKRVVRALEIYHVTGKPKSWWDKESKKIESPYDSVMICLDFKDREKLYERIGKRVDIMLEEGLVDEVKSLIVDRGIILSDTAKQGIGYKEIIDYLDNKCTLDEAVELIKKGTRNYAKRQLTWFRRYDDIHRIFVDECEKFDDIVNIAKKIISD